MLHLYLSIYNYTYRPVIFQGHLMAFIFLFFHFFSGLEGREGDWHVVLRIDR